MKTNNMYLPANCSKISEDEMLHIDGGQNFLDGLLGK